MKRTLKFAAIVAIAAFSGMCFAPIEDMPSGAKFHPELSQSQMEQLQGGGVAAPVDGASSAPALEPTSGTQVPDSNAEKMLSQSSNGGDSAALSLKQSNKDQKQPVKESGKNFFFAGLFLLIGLASVYGIRVYLDKTVPEAAARKK